MKRPKVIFNASVIIAGIGSPDGGSGKLISWVKIHKIIGIISEIILDEAVKHADKIGLTQDEMEKKIGKIFIKPFPAPLSDMVSKYKPVVTDYGDSHVLASCEELAADYLVTLDKKHLLVLADRIKLFQIFSPKQLIEKLSK